MNIEHIKPFLQGAQTIINQICGENLTVGKMFAKEAPYKCEAASASVAITGDVSGNVIYTMNLQTGCDIASKMMGGMAVSALDDMTKSALGELTNMISSNASTILSGAGLKMSLSAPIFRSDATAADFDFIKAGAKLICVPLQFQNGNIFEIDFLFS